MGDRQRIFTDEEIEDLYELPDFTDEERGEVFSLDDNDWAIINKLSDPAAKIHYVLQKGYFYALQYFFYTSFQKVKDDVKYIIGTHFPELKFPKKQISKHHHYANLRRILDKFNYKLPTAQEQLALHQHAKQLVRRHCDPKFMIDELLTFCQQKHWVRPAYSTLQSIISRNLQDERRRLQNKMGSSCPKALRQALDKLLIVDEGSAVSNLQLLQKSPKDFNTTEMRKEVEKQQQLKLLYEYAETIIPTLDISAHNISYYSELALFYTASQLRRFNRNLSRLYLLCYMYQRYFQVNENLLTFFSYRTTRFYQQADDFAKAELIKTSDEQQKRIENAGKLAMLYADRSIPDQQLRKKAFDIIPESDMNHFADALTKTNDKKRKKLLWDNISKNSQTIKTNLRPVFKAIHFSECQDESLKVAIEFVKSYWESQTPLPIDDMEIMPLSFIPKSLREQVIVTTTDPQDKRKRVKQIDPGRYEFMLYWRLQQALTAGKVFVKDSINHRSLEDELIPLDVWEKDKETILRKLNQPLLLMPIKELLALLKSELTERYEIVNNNIQSGKNKHIKIRDNGREVYWTLPYKKREDAVNNPFYKQFTPVNIAELLQSVVEKVELEKTMTKIQPSHTQPTRNRDDFIACLVANGLGLGIDNMAAISDRNHYQLNVMNQSCFRYDTLHEANDWIVNAIKQLPIFQFYTLAEYGIHASIDGQKVRTRTNTIKARRSKKYFALGKGLSSYKLVANHVPINDRIIGANEHESHFLFDVLYNNSSDVDIAAISGDMHSINRVNFALLYLFGFRFMPRFTQLPSKAETQLVSFQSPSEFSDQLIKPSAKIDTKLIIKEWDNVLRILASLGLKETSQATIVRKLSSFKSPNPTLKALIEFDKIIMSSYMLEYINDVDMRRNVQRSLNRGEALHQLIAGLRQVSDKKLPGQVEGALLMYNESNRLLANCIIYYNACLLSTLYEAAKACNESRYLREIIPALLR